MGGDDTFFAELAELRDGPVLDACFRQPCSGRRFGGWCPYCIKGIDGALNELRETTARWESRRIGLLRARLDASENPTCVAQPPGLDGCIAELGGDAA